MEEAGLDDVLENAKSHDEMDAETKQKSKMVRAAMLRRVNKEERSLLQRDRMLSAKDVWDRLHASYGIQNAATSMRTLGKYRTLKKMPSESVMQYYTRALSLASELRESGEKISEADIVATTLNGLPRDYNLVKTTINASGEMPTLDRLKMILVNEEYNMQGDDVVMEQAHMNHDRSETRSQPLVARVGHAKEKKRKFNGKCYKCGKQGHMARYCRQGTETDKQGWSMRVTMESSPSIRDRILDSGASDHMTGDLKKFDEETLEQASGQIMVADGRSTAIAGKGNVTLKIGKLEVQLSNMLYVPNMAYNLISATKMGRQLGANIVMRSDRTCVLQRDQDIVELQTHTNGVHALQAEADLWHKRLCHASSNTLKQIGLPDDMKSCEACVKAKLSRKAYAHDETLKKPLDRISMDLIGPFTPEAVGGQTYALVAVDAATKFSLVTLLLNKGQATDAAKQAITWLEQLSGEHVKCMRTDYGKEFLQENMRIWLSEKGINHEKTTSYEPQLSDQVE
eukprot:scaffold75_cov392-Pavlova_lutheri.AAC.2